MGIAYRRNAIQRKLLLSDFYIQTYDIGSFLFIPDMFYNFTVSSAGV